jgi:ubiquinone/menaquinone biosynthesis C-methylase UbiE
VDVLPVKPCSVVLDLACGKGAYSFFLFKMVGENGLVYAVDLWDDMVQCTCRIDSGFTWHNPSNS